MFRHLVCAAIIAAITPSARAADGVSPEQRIRDMEQRLDRIEAAAPADAPSAAPAAAANSFNPAISLILSGLYTHLSQDPAGYRITGFPLPAGTEVGPGSRGFSLTESELGVYANIDPYFYGGLNFSIHPDDSVSTEEAFIQTIALSQGFTIKAGRFFSGIGYLNEQHAHTWDFVDAPLAYQAFLGTQRGDDGVQVKWLAPTDTFLEFGAELGRGRSYPATNRAKNGAGASSVFVHTGGDVGISHSWRAGLSALATAPRDRLFSDSNLAGNTAVNAFSGDTRLWIADFVWKYAPNGNTVYTNFKLQAEYIQRRDNGNLTYDANGALGATRTVAYDANQSGWYLQGTYQFLPYWRIGLRTEQLAHGSVDYASNSLYLAQANFNPSKQSVMLDFNPSEFSRIRVQFAQDKSRQGITDNQAFVQYQMSIGAHGAHQF